MDDVRQAGNGGDQNPSEESDEKAVVDGQVVVFPEKPPQRQPRGNDQRS
jgi:hypothetical protein